MPRVRPMLAISIGFTIAAAVMLALAAALTATRSTAVFVSLDRDGAVSSVVIAAMCWLELRRDRQREKRDGERGRVEDEYRRREEALIRTLSSQLSDAPTGPLRQLRAL